MGTIEMQKDVIFVFLTQKQQILTLEKIEYELYDTQYSTHIH